MNTIQELERRFILKVSGMIAKVGGFLGLLFLFADRDMEIAGVVLMLFLAGVLLIDYYFYCLSAYKTERDKSLSHKRSHRKYKYERLKDKDNEEKDTI